MAEQAAAVLPVGMGTRVLDLGAGTGAFTARALERGARVTAVDAAPAMVARLRREHPAAGAAVMDAHELGFGDDSFDVVMAGFVMHLLDDSPAAAAEVRRVLAPRGVFAFSTPGPPPGMPDAESPGAVTPFSALWGEFSAYLPAGSRVGGPLDQIALLNDAGFSGAGCHAISVALPLPRGGETLWAWHLTHGTGWTIDNLPPDRRAEFRDRLIAEADAAGARTLQATATLWAGTQPREGRPRAR